MNDKAVSYTMGSAVVFVLVLGAVNYFADMTYEGGAAINGQFLRTLGAAAAAVSIIAGLGEFLGYGLRSVADYAADKTGRYWLITFFGYTITPPFPQARWNLPGYPGGGYAAYASYGNLEASTELEVALTGEARLWYEAGR